MAELKYAALGGLIADANLKAYYRMEAGALTTDSSGQGKTLTNNNTVGEADGKYGGGADFGTANSNKYFSIADKLGIDGGNYSVSCWVKLRTEITVDGTIYQLVDQGGSTTDVYFHLMYQRAAGVNKMTMQRFKNGVGGQSANYNVSLGTSAWHHIVGTYDGTNCRLYVDGVLRDTQPASGTGTGVTDGFWIGSNTGVVQFSSVYLDDVAIFDRVLSQTDVDNLFNDLTASANQLTNYRSRKRTAGAVSV